MGCRGSFSRRSIIGLVLALSFSAGGAEERKPPIPKLPEQAKAEHLIRLKYKTEYAQKDPADRLALAKKMRLETAQFADDLPVRFVMLREARELAVDGGDLDESFAAIDQMDREFAIDAREMKFSVMTEAIDKSPLQPYELVGIYLKMSERALSVGDIDFSNKAITLCNLLTTRTHDKQLKERVAIGALGLADARREQNAIRADIGKLKAHPEDEAMNFAVGRYVCFVLGQWPPGVLYLSRGNDAALKGLAEKERAATDAEALASAADGWWDYSNPAIGATVEKVRKHAADLYKRALSGLSGTAKGTAEQRIASVEKQ